MKFIKQELNTRDKIGFMVACAGYWLIGVCSTVLGFVISAYL